MTRQVIDGVRHSMPRDVIPRGKENKVKRAHARRFHLVVADGGKPYLNVELGKLRLTVVVRGEQLERYARIAGAEVGKKIPHEPVRRDAFAHQQLAFAFGLDGAGVGAPHGAVEMLRRRVDVVVQTLAGAGEGALVRVAPVEQLHADGSLELLDGAADRRLLHTQLDRGYGKAPRSGDGIDRPEFVPVDVG